MKALNVKTLKFKWPNKKRHINVPLYGGAYYFCTDPEEYREVFEFLTTTKEPQGFEFYAGCVTPMENEVGSALYLIGVFDGSYGTLCHEVGHLALFVLERAGVPTTAEGSEAFCYLSGHFFEVCQELLDEDNLRRVEAEQAEEEAAAAEKKRVDRAQKRADAKELRAEQDRQDAIFKEKQASKPEAPEKPLKVSKDKGGARDRR